MLGTLGLGWLRLVTPPDAASAAPTKNADGQARLIVYRSSYYGLAIQPKLFVDGKEVGTCAPGNVINVPVKPGAHVISGRTLTEVRSSVNVPAAENVYVECGMRIGLITGTLVLQQNTEADAAPVVKKMLARQAN